MFDIPKEMKPYSRADDDVRGQDDVPPATWMDMVLMPVSFLIAIVLLFLVVAFIARI